MSGLRDRILRLTRSSERETASEQPLTTSVEGSYDQEAVEWARVDAEIHRVRDGTFIKRTRRYPLEHAHGRYRLGELRSVTDEFAVLGHIERELADASQLLFFDTETTGLGVGAGNVPFMIGYGYMEETQFVVEQLFIRNPAEEHDALSYLRDVISRFSHVITYNGRSFDWPVLMNRFVLQRLAPPSEPAHIDLLYPSRSLWKESLPSCRLGVIEEQKLGLRRAGDLPGSEAPARYVQYLSSKRIDDVIEVFVHNERDILSLAALTVCFQELLSGATSKLTVPGIVREDGVKLAAWLDRLDRRGWAREALLTALRTDSISRTRLLEAASLWKRWHEYDQAAACWHLYCRRSHGKHLTVEPLIELAIYYEHRVRDIEAAITWARQAREVVERRMALGRRREIDRDLLRQIDHRLARLFKKNGKPTQELLNFH